MKILSAKQLQEADRVTIEKQNISSTDLMERAAGLVFNEIHKRLQGAELEIKIFCGIGNNGGDGLVIGRMLVEHGYNVKVFVVNYSDNRSGDFLKNYDRYKNTTNTWPILITSEVEFPVIEEGDFVIDAMFGTGLNRPIEGWVATLARHINKSKAFVLAVDMPSGLFADEVPGEKAAIIKANFTLSFQTPKLSFFLPQTMDLVGDWQILDIGLDREFIFSISEKAELIGRNEAQFFYQNRKKNSHKGSYGHTLVVGGSYGKIGSIVLSATAVLKSGAGLCSVFVPSCGYSILQTALPEAMVITDNNNKQLTRIQTEFTPDVICFGMGAGTLEETVLAFEDLLKENNSPMLIDADGLNMLAQNNHFLNLLPENSVLTPHPKELERLIGKWKNDTEKIQMVQEFIKKYNVIIVLKGAHTFCFHKEKIYINNSGNPGMATAGAGDVLSGIIAGLISQQYPPEQAAVLGVYLHGLAGDLAAQQMGYEAIIAGEITNHLGKAFQRLIAREENDKNQKQ